MCIDRRSGAIKYVRSNVSRVVRFTRVVAARVRSVGVYRSRAAAAAIAPVFLRAHVLCWGVRVGAVAEQLVMCPEMFGCLLVVIVYMA